MKKTQQKIYHRMRRRGRIRSQVSGTAVCPRLAVFRSNRFVNVQLIDDERGVTLGAASDQTIKKGNKVERATQVGTEIAKVAQAKKITKVVFDRGGFLYTGRVKALADAARAGGLTF